MFFVLIGFVSGLVCFVGDKKLLGERRKRGGEGMQVWGGTGKRWVPAVGVLWDLLRRLVFYFFLPLALGGCLGILLSFVPFAE